MNHLALIPINLLIFLLSSEFPSGFAAEKFQEDGLKLHNELRAKHGIPPLTLDNNLNKVAQTCAEYYLTGKDSHTCPGADPYGENIGMQVSMSLDLGLGTGAVTVAHNISLEKETTEAINRWYDERKGYNYDEPKRSRGVYGHFTQLVWRATTKLGLGCAVGKEHETTTYCVAIYDPPGNLKGSYEKNVPAPNRIFVQAEPEVKSNGKLDSPEVIT